MADVFVTQAPGMENPGLFRKSARYSLLAFAASANNGQACPTLVWRQTKDQGMNSINQ
jgi:hypothetical protein